MLEIISSAVGWSVERIIRMSVIVVRFVVIYRLIMVRPYSMPASESHDGKSDVLDDSLQSHSA